MNLTVQYHENVDLVEAVPAAEITKENVWKTIEEALKVAKNHGCLRLLFDIRQCPIGQSMTQGLSTMNNLMAIPGMTYKHRTAVIFDPSTYPTERAEFIENVVNNRANPAFRIFASREGALAWLTAQSPE